MRLKMTENQLLWGQHGAMRMNRLLESLILFRTRGTSLNGGNAYANRFFHSSDIASTAQALWSGTGETNRGRRWFNLVAKRSIWGVPQRLKIWVAISRSRDHSVGRISLGETGCLPKHPISLEYAWLECEYSYDDTSKEAPILACTEMESGSPLASWGKPLLMNCLTLPSRKNCKCDWKCWSARKTARNSKLLMWRSWEATSHSPWTSRPRGSKCAPQPEWLSSENRWKSGAGITRGIPAT